MRRRSVAGEVPRLTQHQPRLVKSQSPATELQYRIRIPIRARSFRGSLSHRGCELGRRASIKNLGPRSVCHPDKASTAFFRHPYRRFSLAG
jgi:hypothetical protein